MNSFYHSFSIGFNWWFVLLPLQVVIMVAFGLSNVKLAHRTRKILRRDKKGTIAALLAISMDVILMIAIVMESSAGIIQVIDNHLSAEDDPTWSLVLFVLSLVVFAFLMYNVFFGASVFGTQVKTAYYKGIRKGN